MTDEPDAETCWKGGENRATAGGRPRRAAPCRLAPTQVSSPATVKIVYEETYGELVGSELFSQFPRLEAPMLPEPLRPPKFLRWTWGGDVEGGTEPRWPGGRVAARGLEAGVKHTP
jgi:hypothetical protein